MHIEEPAGAQRSGTSDSRISPSEAPGSVPLGRTSVPSNADAPRAARAAIAQWLPASFPRTVLQDAQLLVSELVSNSFQHGAPADGAPITLTAGTRDGAVWFSVTDAGGRGRVKRRPAKPKGGMGLNIVDAAASRWGSSDGDGTHVWFELALTGSPPPPTGPLQGARAA